MFLQFIVLSVLCAILIANLNKQYLPEGLSSYSFSSRFLFYPKLLDAATVVDPAIS